MFLFSLPLSLQALEENDTLHIAELLKTSDVVIVGWSHIPQNAVVMNLVYEGLKKAKNSGEKVSLMVEDSDEEPDTSINMAGQANDLFVKSVQDLGVPLIKGDLGPSKLPFPSPQDPRNVKKRDAAFSASTAKALREGQKVVLLVGAAHLLGISVNLSVSRIINATVLTEYDNLTGRVLVDDKVVAQGEVDPVLQKEEKAKINYREALSALENSTPDTEVLAWNRFNDAQAAYERAKKESQDHIILRAGLEKMLAKNPSYQIILRKKFGGKRPYVPDNELVAALQAKIMHLRKCGKSMSQLIPML